MLVEVSVCLTDFASGLSDLDFNLDAAGEFEFHQGVHGLGGGVVDVDEAFERRKLELLAGLLVDEGRAVNGEDALVGGQGNGSANHGAGGFHGLHNLFGRLVDEIVVVGFQFDSDFLAHFELRKIKLI